MSLAEAAGPAHPPAKVTLKRMNRKSIGAFPFGKRRNRTIGSGGPFALRLLLLLVLSAGPLGGQNPGQLGGGQPSPLPATTGDPLTIAPIDLPDIDCAIHEWNPSSPKPVLTLLCPPRPVFAPLRVYLKLSWMKPEDVPVDVGKIIARPRELTRIRTNKSAVMVRLAVAGERGQLAQAKWVSFNGVVDVALIKDSRGP